MRVLATSKEQVKIDLTDKKILFLLSHNARFSYSTIAKHVNLSREAVKQRIQKLLKNNVLLGFQALVDVSKLGYSSYHLFVQLRNPKKEVEEMFVKELLADKNLNALLNYHGRYDFEISYILKDINKLNEKLKVLPSSEIKEQAVCIMLNNIVSKTYPTCMYDFKLELKKVGRDGSFHGSFNKKKAKDVKIDSTDYHLLSLISDNARITMVDLAAKLKLSVDAAIYRVRKMIESNIILQFRPIINYAALGHSVYCLFFKFKNFNKDKEIKFNYYVKQSKNFLWSAHCIGPFNNISYIIVKDTFQFHNVINEIREQFYGIIDSYESMLSFAEFKYTYFPEGLSKEK